MPRENITNLDTMLTVRGRRLLAPSDAPGIVTCPAVPGATYTLPERITRKLPANLTGEARTLLAGVSVMVCAYRSLAGSIDDVNVADMWAAAIDAAAQPPGHTRDNAGSFECCNRCRHDLAVHATARLLAVVPAVRFHVTFTPLHEVLDLAQLFADARGILDDYVQARTAQYHHDHPTTGLLIPSTTTTKAAQKTTLHLHALLDGHAITAAQLQRIAKSAGYGVGGDLRRPVPNTLHDHARVIAYATRQVLTDDPLTTTWRTSRYGLWTTGKVTPPSRPPRPR